MSDDRVIDREKLGVHLPPIGHLPAVVKPKKTSVPSVRAVQKKKMLSVLLPFIFAGCITGLIELAPTIIINGIFIAVEKSPFFMAMPTWYLAGRERSFNAATTYPSCSQSANFLNRTTGQDTVHSIAYDNLICGLVNQSSTISGTLFSRLDGLWTVRGKDSTVILLNLIQNSFNLTSHGTITFSADSGVTGDGSTGYYDTGLNFSTAGGQCVLNSCMLIMCNTQNWSSGGLTVGMGGADSSAANQIYSDGTTEAAVINALAGAGSGSTLAAGLWSGIRSASNLTTIYLGTTSQGTAGTASVSLPNQNLALLAQNNNGTIGFFTANQHVMFATGAQYSATDLANFRTLIQSYMSAIGSAAC